MRHRGKTGNNAWHLPGLWRAVLFVILVSLVCPVFASETGVPSSSASASAVLERVPETAPGAGIPQTEVANFSESRPGLGSGPATPVRTLREVRVAPETDRTPILPALRNRTAVVETPAAITIVRPTVNVPAGVLITIALIAGAGIFAIAYLLFVRNRNMETGTGRENTAGEESRHATLVPVMPGRVPDGEHGFPRNGPDAAFPASLEKRFLNPEFIGREESHGCSGRRTQRPGRRSR